MSQSLTDIKHRIASVKSTEQITKAMRMVSASKMSQVQRQYAKYEVYDNKLRNIVQKLAHSQTFQNIAQLHESDPESLEGVYFDQTEQAIVNSFLASQKDGFEENSKRTAYLVITGDRGLVGSYNSSVLKSSLKMLRQDHEKGEEPLLFCAGSVGVDFFHRRGINIDLEIMDVSDSPSFGEVRKIIVKAIDLFQKGLYGKLLICYNHFVNSLTSSFRIEQVLPLSDLEIFDKEYDSECDELEFLPEPDPVTVLDTVLPQYAESLIYGAILDAKLAEHSASTMAMKSASDNAEDLISRMSIEYNRARQAAITTEINEIVGGASALE
ncbi:ATP synthase F1 subunit gamma [Xylocopilactobacillus apicola]|uniref:ATP synthase gamma chain n=1 Tax=Xylocopilactobacillus apicola TaxID=2932184 RepID=A0AAU9CWD6_9LACO|nr:ATP synthase F1 subunit gamma [Xylocopilactobacillus apicola]BDR58274.1 ATP synthase gamma chain [Xylocopilactobacillus apicola]